MRSILYITAAATALTTPAIANTPNEAAKAWEEGRQADAVAIWSALGAKGDRDALYNLGQAARTGRGMAKDSAAAVTFYRQALKAGHPKAGEVLGLMLFAVPETKSEGLNLLERAAENGSPRANYALAITELRTAENRDDVQSVKDRLKIALSGGIDAAKEPLAAIEQKLVALQVKPAPAIMARQDSVVQSAETFAPQTIPSSTKLWRVSLGSYETDAIAAVKWLRISARQRLKAFPVFIEPSSGNYRLSFGNFASENDAQVLCKRLDTNKTKCKIFVL